MYMYLRRWPNTTKPSKTSQTSMCFSCCIIQHVSRWSILIRHSFKKFTVRLRWQWLSTNVLPTAHTQMLVTVVRDSLGLLLQCSPPPPIQMGGGPATLIFFIPTNVTTSYSNFEKWIDISVKLLGRMWLTLDGNESGSSSTSLSVDWFSEDSVDAPVAMRKGNTCEQWHLTSQGSNTSETQDLTNSFNFGRHTKTNKQTQENSSHRVQGRFNSKTMFLRSNKYWEAIFVCLCNANSE